MYNLGFYYSIVSTISEFSAVTTTKYIKYINSIHGMHMSFYHVVLVKFYCDIINKSRLQLINTLIDTFFSKLRALLVE